MLNTKIFFAASLCFLTFLCFPNQLIASNITDSTAVLGNAKVIFKDNVLFVSTGKVTRSWQWTGSGFVTSSFKNLESNKEWATTNHNYESDWNLPTKIEAGSPAVLNNLGFTITDDEHFTSNHILVVANMTYDCGLEINFLVRVYPEAYGTWTALEVKSKEGFSSEGIPEDVATYKYYGSNQPIKIARSEFIPIDFSIENKRKYWGIYNNPGNRVNTDNMVKERTVKGYPIFQDEQNKWANGLVVSSVTDGLILVKESNKTVNKSGHQTGAFYCTKTGVEVTGWGLKPKEINNSFKRTWATWAILFSGAENEMELSLKQFDRVRYPVHKGKDMHILIDTWGSDWQNNNYEKIYGRENSAYSVIEKEIKSAADLGIDIVRIDDGWQEGHTKSKGSWHPNTKMGYEANWEKVKQLSQQYQVRIGLWAAVDFITMEELIDNQNKLDVATWKFDFDQLEDHDSFATRNQMIREFIKKSNYATQTSWCPEYDDQRYGWYSPVREYGPMYFQNIQNNLPNHLVYVPYITLRHHWMMAKYFNLNDLQLHWQNTSRTNPDYSDAYLHSQSYAAMSALVGAPSCFMLTQLLKPEERTELKQLISIYKKHRNEIFDCYIFPIGSEPNNASWTGFQISSPDKSFGYLMVFRELHNKKKTEEINLRFLKNDTLKITNLELEAPNTTVMTAKDGKIKLQIDNPADYLFLKYEVLKPHK